MYIYLIISFLFDQRLEMFVYPYPQEDMPIK